MDLSLEGNNHYLHVRNVAAHHITVADRKLTNSFILTPKQIIEHWPVTDVSMLAETHVDAILRLHPEVLILGSGVRQIFPAAIFIAAFLNRHIGIEIMDNASAARTYDLLASEGREVVAAFILT